MKLLFIATIVCYNTLNAFLSERGLIMNRIKQLREERSLSQKE